MKCNAFLVTANNQLTIKPKDGKKLFVGSQPESIIAFQELHFYHCCHLVSYQVVTLVKAQVLEGDDGLRLESHRRLYFNL